MICKLVATTPTELEELIQHPEQLFTFLFPDDPYVRRAETCSLDKAWHGIHFILTGTAWAGDPPLSLAVLGGTQIGEDTGYGPARYLTPEQVCRVAEAFGSVTQETLLYRCNREAMNAAAIYPTDVGEASGYLLGYLDDLREFYNSATAHGHAVLICLS